MTDPVVYGMSNEQYHHGEEERQYLSSSQLKWYLRSPKFFKHNIDNPTEEKSDALRFGSLFHMAMEKFQQYGTIDAFYNCVAIFTPPKNDKTGQSYGTTTKAYAESYNQFLADNQGKEIATLEEVQLIDDMVGTLVRPSVGGATATQVLKLLKWGKPEVSHFIEYDGLKFKWRPDLETRKKIIDWKTVSTDDLSERSINSIISKYGYDISAAFYLFMEHEQSGKWKQFYWVFVSKQPPYDAVMVDASEWTYKHEDGIILPQVGAIKFKALLDLHIQCSRKNEWPGSEIFIPQADNGLRIMCPTPPPWEVSNAANLLEQSFNE